MTTYTTITNALVAVGAKPFASTIQALRDNPIAIGEADATVPLDLLPTVLLGTINTTSGTTQTLSSLVLTPYKFLLAVFDGVSLGASGSTNTLSVFGRAVFSRTSANYTNVRGWVVLDLATGVGHGSMAEVSASSATADVRVIDSTTSTASTSVSVSNTPASFNAGSVLVYGIK